MASDRRPSLSTAFDDMLERNWQELNKLSSHIDERSSSSESHASSSRAAFQAKISTQSPIVEQLNKRFGDNWRYEVTDRQRDGDDVFVLCKLILPEKSVTKAQFGLARIGSAVAGSGIHGSSTGVNFSLGASKTESLTGDNENAAFERATDDALTKCAAML
tara:strand:+ start:242 stop:724 length:483 start_codon:yes stop_codon:yes gene_type:complete